MIPIKIVGVTIAAGLIAITSAMSLRPAPNVAAAGLPAGTSLVTETSPADLRVLLTRLGLPPERLAGAGVAAESVSGVVTAVAGQHQGFAAQLATAESTFTASAREHDRLMRLVVSGRASAQDKATYALAKTARDAAEATRDALLHNLFTSGVSLLNEVQRTQLTAFRRSPWAGAMPVELLTLSKSDTEWLAIRDALDSVAASQHLGEDPDPQARQLLIQVRAEAPAAAARAALDQNLAGVTSAWEQATASQ